MKKICPPRVGEVMKAAVPCFVEQALNVLSSVLITMIIGHLGAYEMTATAMANTMFNWLQCTFTGFSVGATVIIGRMYGKNDEEGIKKVAFQAIKLIMLIGIAVAAITILFREPIVMLFYGSAEKKVIDNLLIYLFLILLGMPAIAGNNSMNACLRGIGDNRTPMLVSVLLNIISLSLGFILIYGFAPLNIPEFGIFGAGIAATVSRYVGLIFEAVFILIKRKNLIPKKYTLGFDADIFKRIMNIGIPSAVEQFVFNGGFVILTMLLVGFGTIFQAGYQIGSNISNILQTISVALNVAIVAFISRSLGAKNWEAAREYVRAARFIVCTVVVTYACLAAVAAPWLAAMFSNEQDVISEGTFFAVVYAVLQIPIAYMQAMTGVLKGAGDAKYIMVTNIGALWIFRIFGVWAISQFCGDGHIVFVIGMSLDFVLRAVAYDIRVRKEKWLHIRV